MCVLFRSRAVMLMAWSVLLCQWHGTARHGTVARGMLTLALGTTGTLACIGMIFLKFLLKFSFLECFNITSGYNNSLTII